MHYYSFHVSDYIHDTAHLSIIEDLAFRRLLDLYYTSEKPIPNRTHEVSRRIRMSEHEDAVQTFLRNSLRLTWSLVFGITRDVMKQSRLIMLKHRGTERLANLVVDLRITQMKPKWFPKITLTINQ